MTDILELEEILTIKQFHRDFVSVYILINGQSLYLCAKNG